MNCFLIELVVDDFRLIPLRETKLLRRDEGEYQALHVAVRAIALDDLLEVGIYFKAILPAVAASCVRFHTRHRTTVRLGKDERQSHNYTEENKRAYRNYGTDRKKYVQE